MKNWFITFLAIFILLPFFPWWLLWVILGIGGWFTENYRVSIISGGSIAAAAWGLQLGIGFFAEGGTLMNRIAEMLGMGSTPALILISLILSAMLGGLSGISGYHLHKFFIQK